MVKEQTRLIRWLGRLSLASGIIGAMLVVAFSQSGWGEPGSAAYQRYELLNRLMSGTLLLMAAGWLGVWLNWPAGYRRWGMSLAVLGSLAMVIGNAAEFWLFSGRPYGEGGNLRSLSWTVFGLGGLVQHLGASAAGASIWRGRFWPRWLGLVLMLSLPLDIVCFILVSPFLASAGLALAIGRFLLVQSRRPYSLRDDNSLVIGGKI